MDGDVDRPAEALWTTWPLKGFMAHIAYYIGFVVDYGIQPPILWFIWYLEINFFPRQGLEAAVVIAGLIT